MAIMKGIFVLSLLFKHMIIGHEKLLSNEEEERRACVGERLNERWVPKMGGSIQTTLLLEKFCRIAQTS